MYLNHIIKVWKEINYLFCKLFIIIGNKNVSRDQKHKMYVFVINVHELHVGM